VGALQTRIAAQQQEPQQAAAAAAGGGEREGQAAAAPPAAQRPIPRLIMRTLFIDEAVMWAAGGACGGTFQQMPAPAPAARAVVMLGAGGWCTRGLWGRFVGAAARVAGAMRGREQLHPAAASCDQRAAAPSSTAAAISRAAGCLPWRRLQGWAAGEALGRAC